MLRFIRRGLLGPLSLLVLQVFSQSIPTYNTCPTRTITLPDSRGFYNIQHISVPGSSETCVLTLTYASSEGSYAIVEGVKEPDEGQCQGSRITVGAKDLCVVSGAYWAQRADSERSTLVVTTRTSESDFTINVYSSVDTCGISSSSDSSWSGVVSSPFGGAKIPQTDCHSTLSGLPGDAQVKVTALSPLGIKAATLSIVGQNRVNVAAVSDVVYVEVRETGKVTVRRTLDDPDNTLTVGQFALVYTVIRCEDIPEIENTTHTPIQPPYLPGSTVQYSCGDDYKFKNTSYITCEERIHGKALWSDDIMCIPVPWCLQPPHVISQASQIVVTTNRTVSYECEEGYESTYGPNITVTCSTTDEDRQPWGWNDTNIDKIFQCSPVQCEVAMISNIKNGALDDNTTAYNYGDTVTYKCVAGYKKTTAEPIRCESDKSWSVVPGCDQVYCTRIPNIPNQLVEVQSNSTGNKLAYGDMITVKCVEGYKLRSQNLNRWICSQSESWVSSNDDSIEYDEQLLPLCGKSDNSDGNTDLRKGMAELRSEISSMIILSSVLGVVCLLLMIVIVVFIRLYHITPKDVKQRITKKGGKTDRFEAQGMENVRHNAAAGVKSQDEYEDVSVGPAGVNISMNTAQQLSGISGYEQISPRIAAANSTYENTAYQGDQGDGHEYAKLGQLA